MKRGKRGREKKEKEVENCILKKTVKKKKKKNSCFHPNVTLKIRFPPFPLSGSLTYYRPYTSPTFIRHTVYNYGIHVYIK